MEEVNPETAIEEEALLLNTLQDDFEMETNITNTMMGDFENGTFHAPVLNQAALTKSIILLVMVFFSLLGNIATMVSIKRSKTRRSHIHIYVLIYHLSVADIAVTLWCILGEAIWFLTVEWLAGNAFCKIFKYFQMMSLYLSTFIMVLIGVDRFIAIRYPLKSTSKRSCFKAIGICWILSAILSFPQLIIFRVNKGPFVEPFYQCVTYGFYSEQWQEELYAGFSLLSMFVIPLLILITTYILTICALQRNEEILENSFTNFHSLMGSNRRRLMHKAKMKSLRLSVAIVVTFLVCWCPYFALMIISIFFKLNEGDGEDRDLKDAIFFFGMSNSLFNPLIYGIFHLRKRKRREKSTVLTNIGGSIRSVIRQRSDMNNLRKCSLEESRSGSVARYSSANQSRSFENGNADNTIIFPKTRKAIIGGKKEYFLASAADATTSSKN